MTRYLVGVRASGSRRAGLEVIAKPPTFYQPQVRQGRRRDPERISWASTGYAWHAKRGVVEEWRDEHGRLAIARVFPEEFADDLRAHDDAVAKAEIALREARASRQEFLDTVASRALPVRIEDARRERDEWPNTDAGRAEKARTEAELKRASAFMGRMNDLVFTSLTKGGK